MSRRITYFIVFGLALGAGPAVAKPGAEKAPPQAGPIVKNDDAALPAGARLQLGKLAGFRYAGQAAAATLSADGKLLAAAGLRGPITIYNAESGQIVQTLKVVAPSDCSMTFSADNSTLAMQNAANLIVWDVATGKPRQNIQGRGTIGSQHDPSLSADGKIVGAAYERTAAGKRQTGEITAVDVVTGKTIGPFESIHNRGIRTAIAPDGKTMLSWGQTLSMPEENNAGSIIQVWDLVKGQELRKLKFDAFVRTAAFAPDGKTVAAAIGVSSFQLVEFETGKETNRFPGDLPFGPVSLRYSPDGRQLVAFDYGGGLQVRHLADGKRIALVDAPKMGMLAVAFPAKDRVVAMGRLGPTLCWWDATDAKASRFEGHLAPLAALAFSADGQTLVAASNDQRFIFWDPATGKEQRRLALPTADRFSTGIDRPVSIALTFDGTRAATRERFGNRGVHLWDLKDGRALREFSLTRLSSSYAVPDMKFSADGRNLSLAGMDAPASVWDANTGKAVYTMPTALFMNGDPDTRAAVSPDGKIVAIYQFDPYGDQPEAINEIILWDLAAKKELRRISMPSVNPGPNILPGLAFSADGKFLAVTDSQGTALYSTASGREWCKLISVGRNSTAHFAFSADGRFLAAANAPRMFHVPGAGAEDVGVEIWEIASGQKRQQYKGHAAGVTCLAFSPDGATLATGSLDTTVLLWDFAGKHTKAAPFAESEMPAAWNSLVGADANVSLTMRRLIRTPATVDFLKQHFPPAKHVKLDVKKLAALVADLDSGNFKAREFAMRELKLLGVRAEAVLKNRLAGNPTVEARRRIQNLLEAMAPAPATAQELQAIRGVEILERIATPEARAWLSALSKGDPLARGTQEAAAALKRMK